MSANIDSRLFSSSRSSHNHHFDYSAHGGGFFLACKDFGRMFDHSFPACAFFFYNFFYVEICSRTLIPLFCARISPQWLSHFLQNDWGLLCDTAVTRGWNEHRVRVNRKVNSVEENFPAAPAKIRTRNLSITCPRALPTSYPGSR